MARRFETSRSLSDHVLCDVATSSHLGLLDYLPSPIGIIMESAQEIRDHLSGNLNGHSPLLQRRNELGLPYDLGRALCTSCVVLEPD